MGIEVARRILLAVMFFAIGSISISAQSASHALNWETTCRFWQGIVDEQIKRSDIIVDLKSDKDVLSGMKCLLQMEGNKHRAGFSGVTRLDVSQVFDEARADVAALYYVSFMFTRNWQHADAVALVRVNGGVSTNEIVKTAYRGYRKWFEEVEKLGLENARNEKLDPLAGTGIRWY